MVILDGNAIAVAGDILNEYGMKVVMLMGGEVIMSWTEYQGSNPRLPFGWTMMHHQGRVS